jgi:hypothetical protein
MDTAPRLRRSGPTGTSRPARHLVEAVATIALALVVAACGSSASPSPSPVTPTPSSAPTPAPTPTPHATQPASASPSAGPPSSAGPAPSLDPAVIAEIERQVAGIRRLDALETVDTAIVDEAQAKALLVDGFRKENTPQNLADGEQLLRGLGLWSTDRSLEEVLLSFLESQVLGFYRDTDKKLYIVSRSGGFGPLERYTASHELTHALQDQHFDLGSLGLDRKDQGDRALAVRALVEGDATLAGTYWAQANLTMQELVQMAGLSMDPAQQAILDGMPAIVREQMLFPYVDGLTFAMRLQQGGWDAVDAAYRKLPASTEQILHPDKYVAGEKPIDVALPDALATRLGAGWSKATEDTLGELQLRVWLETAGSAVDAKAAASDWGGDRVGLYRGPDGAWAIVIATAWDTPEAADRFSDAASKATSALPFAEVVSRGQGPMVLIGSDAAALEALRVEALAP